MFKSVVFIYLQMGSCYLPIFYTGSGGSDKLEIKYKNTWEYNQT